MVEGFDYHNGACEYGYDLDGDGTDFICKVIIHFFDIGQTLAVPRIVLMVMTMMEMVLLIVMIVTV